MTLIEVQEQIEKYLNSSSYLPYFVSVDGSDEYNSLIHSYSKLAPIRISSFCAEDSFPDCDSFYDHLKKIEKDSVLLGMGEYSWFSGSIRDLRKIKDLILPHKLLVLCRGSGGFLENISSNDRPFSRLRYCRIESLYDVSVIKVSTGVRYKSYNGFKELLSVLEDGQSGRFYVQTDLDIACGHEITAPYEAILEHNPSFDVPQSCLDSEQWTEYSENNNLSGFPLDDWHTYLSMLINPPENAYLKLVIELSCDYKTYSENLFEAILTIDHNSKNFAELYAQRKSLLSDYGYVYISHYLMKSKMMNENRIYYLTDNTPEERYEIVKPYGEKSISKTNKK